MCRLVGILVEAHFHAECKATLTVGVSLPLYDEDSPPVFWRLGVMNVGRCRVYPLGVLQSDILLDLKVELGVGIAKDDVVGRLCSWTPSKSFLAAGRPYKVFKNGSLIYHIN